MLALVNPPSIAALALAGPVPVAAPGSRLTFIAPVTRVDRSGERVTERRGGAVVLLDEEIGRPARSAAGIVVRPDDRRRENAVYGESALLYMTQRLAQEASPTPNGDIADQATVAYQVTADRGRVHFGSDEPLDIRA